MGFISRMCVFIVVLVIAIVCFFLGIVTLFVAINPFWDSINVFRNTAWSTIELSKETFPRYCNAKSFAADSTERAVMIAMVSCGFVFLVLFVIFTPCMLADKLSKNGLALCGCSAGCAFLSWVFYLTAWAYWVAKDPCKAVGDAWIKANPNASYEHSYGPGFGCAVALWCLLTVALPCICGGSKIKSKE